MLQEKEIYYIAKYSLGKLIQLYLLSKIVCAKPHVSFPYIFHAVRPNLFGGFNGASRSL